MFSNITDVMLHFESDSKLPTRNSEEPKIFMISSLKRLFKKRDLVWMIKYLRLKPGAAGRAA